ncbi:MAG: RES family NAD+ phosphorylase [Chthoniobacteraceae bacterium]
MQVVPASALSKLFAPLVELFEPLEYGKHFHKEFGPDADEVGESLPYCIEWKKGWTIFSDALDDETRCTLLDEIRGICFRPDDDSEVSSGELWAAEEDELFYTSEEGIWHQFAEAIKWKRRFIPDSGVGPISDPRAWLPQFLHKIRVFVGPKQLYHRARLGGIEEHYAVTKPYPAGDMSLPPRTRATAGRANPAGIPYLYVAEAEMTAVSEIRPFLGGLVSVAKVRPRKNLQLVDLTKLRSIDSPFGHADLRMELEQSALLGILNRELAKPVNPALAEIEYVPTQYLAEVILNSDYDGIRYKSAMHGGGFNVVFFDHAKLEIQEKTKLVQVISNKLEYK